ncbi:MAG: HAMP domain-containing protein [Chloroflexales bacterium]|nr:HAMP domain-containing protein [Chloroflexales bacterium]
MIARLRRLPLRTRLALGYSLFFAGVLLLLTTGVYWLVRDALLAEVSQELAATADLVQQDFLASAGPLEGYFSDQEAALRALPPSVEGLEAPTLYIQVTDLEHNVIVTSASLRGQRLPLDVAMHAAALSGRETQTVLALGSGRVMQLTAPLYSGDQVLGVLQVAQPLYAIDQTLWILFLGLAVISLVSVVAAVRGGIWIARRSLRSVEEIAQTARQIVRASDLGRRMPPARADDELGELTATLNELLARLEQLFTAQRRFVADVSHELRTPLTAMRGHLELIQRGVTREGAAQAASVADMLREVNRLSRMANDLLLLAQAEVGIQLRCEPVQLDDLVLETVRELHPLAEQVALRPELHEQVSVSGDRDRLKQALLNLVVNALQHTPPGGRVTVSLAQSPAQAILCVSDTGPGIAPEDLPHLFERFYQADRVGARRGGGAGLGLSIVRWVVEAHRGQITVTSEPGRGATFQLLLPRSPRAR